MKNIRGQFIREQLAKRKYPPYNLNQFALSCRPPRTRSAVGIVADGKGVSLYIRKRLAKLIGMSYETLWDDWYDPAKFGLKAEDDGKDNEER